MKSLRLPIHVKPPILVYQYRAYPLSVTSNYAETEIWLHSNFMHLKCDLNFVENKVDMNVDFIAGSVYGGIPWLEYLDFDFSNYFEYEPYDLCNEIISILDSGYYIYTYADEYHVPHRTSYHKNSLTHDVLIFGYDLSNKSFKIIGFNEKRNYAESEISFDDLVCAIVQSKRNYSKLLKMREEFQYYFDKNNVIDKLEDYLFSRNCAGNLLKYDFDNRTEHMDNLDYSLFNENWGFGMDIYAQIVLFNEALSMNKTNFDIRPLHCLWEHKKSMLERLKYFYQNKLIYDAEIINEYLEIANKINAGRISIIKYSVTKDSGILTNINSSIKEVCEKEIKILSNVTKQLRSV
ncbi:hypothetical protein [Paenibacillus tengchongensis]|uniref:hypothetical protein n=1 Tax=Paenibacillus tengchongensis TaxID=2608684 RepID=UPI00124F557E|nr:hypothetical protein [Paenibacillus tengchongensis]